jgi:hypothetical protein
VYLSCSKLNGSLKPDFLPSGVEADDDLTDFDDLVDFDGLVDFDDFPCFPDFLTAPLFGDIEGRMPER